MELTSAGYNILGIFVPEENKDRGGIVHRHFANWIKPYFENKGFIAHLEWTIPNTSHPVDIAVEIEGGICAYEICITAFDNLASHAEACFEKSNAIKKLTIVVATKTNLKELKKQIKNNLMLARFEDKIQVDVIENYMKRN